MCNKSLNENHIIPNFARKVNQKHTIMTRFTRRNFLKSSLVLGTACSILPSNATPLYIPSKVMKGETAPSNRIHIGLIGAGRIAKDHDLPGVLNLPDTRVVAVCDLDAKRLENARSTVEKYYMEKENEKEVNVRTYEHYEELLAQEDIDAVVICTPDHWHAKIAIEAARAGKDIYLEKPTSLTIEEGRLLSNAVNASGVIFQLGTQQRSMPQFRFACELVRNGRIGKLEEVEIRLPGDPAGGNATEMPIPEGFNYEKWLGTTPYVPYTVDRVHPHEGYGRPGWLRCQQFGAGMITGWGNHHFDIAHWAMGTEYTGPVEIKGEAAFAHEGLWDVHGDYHTEMKYANGVIVRGVTESPEKPNGVWFKGSEGWLYVCRGSYKASANEPDTNASSPLQASDTKILKEKLKETDIHLIESDNHHRNWIDAVKSRIPAISPAEVGHRSCSACLLQHIAMLLKRPLRWDPVMERFLNDDEANAMLSRPMRFPYQIAKSW